MSVRYIALDKATNDIYKKQGGGIVRVTDGRFVVQQVSCKLKAVLGEWILDKSIGFMNLTDLVKDYDLFDIQLRLTEIVTSTQGVLSLDSVDFNYKDRVLKVDFTATTIYGLIDTSIPWDVAEDVFVEPPIPITVETVTHNGVPVTVDGQVLTYQPTVN